MNISIAIVITAQNVGPYIASCLSSCMADARLPSTIYLNDDGSTDDTLPAAKRIFEANPSWIHEVRQLSGVGPGVSRNDALDRVKEDFVAFVDGDDLISRPVLEAICRQMAAYDVDVAAPRTIAFDNSNGSRHDFDKGVSRILGGNRIVITECRASPEILDLETSMCMRVFSRRFLQAHEIRFGGGRFCEDVAPSRRALLMARRIMLSHDEYYYYRLNRPGQRTAKVCATTSDIIHSMEASLRTGMPEIKDDLQGGFLLLRLLRLAFWSVSLVPYSGREALAYDLARVFDGLPIGWWRALYALRPNHARAEYHAGLILRGRSQADIALSFLQPRASLRCRILRKLRGQK